MCGLTGIFYGGAGGGTVDPALLKRMTDAIAHRGPDGEGFHIEPGVGLGHRRLAIIDIGGGAQPMSTSDGRVVVVFNGEIYNFRDLTADLTALGFVFRTQSDTEVILNAWLAWGPDCLKRFNGMFAIALWDSRQDTLLLARDRVGKKPLYYAMDGGKISFASELKALMHCPWIGRELSPQAIEDFLAFGYVPDPKSIYRDVLKLPPAHYLIWRRGQQPSLRAYWDVDLQARTDRLSFEDAAAELQERLRDAVRRRMIADVPLGAFLSGGVDSSGVVAHMAMSSSTPVRTCAVGFHEANHDERAYARKIAERYGTSHSEAVLSGEDLVRAPDDLDRNTALFDEPFADSSSIPTYHVCAIARRQVTVALSGDGGDEVFAGYRRYLWHTREAAVRKLAPQAVRGPLFGLLAKIYPQFERGPRFLRARNTFAELALDATGAYAGNVAAVGLDLRRALYSDEFRRRLQGYSAREVLTDLLEKAPTDRPLLQAQYADLKTWLAGRMLVKVDRTSMANSLEVRSPLLDHELLQWGFSLPDAFKLRGGEYKAVLKRALEPAVPHELLYRRKQGFAVPLAAWLRGPLRPMLTDALSSPVLLDAGLFRPGPLKALLEEHASGARDHSAALWSLLVLQRFLARETKM